MHVGDSFFCGALLAPTISKPSASVLQNISLDPQNITPAPFKKKLYDICQTFTSVFETNFSGYNGHSGHVTASVNMGPVQPPQRKGRLPFYNSDKLDLLQQKADELENLNVLKKPEEVGVVVEYLNTSFLVRKPRGGYRFITDFAEVGRYAKPQPSLLPDG